VVDVGVGAVRVQHKPCDWKAHRVSIPDSICKVFTHSVTTYAQSTDGTLYLWGRIPTVELLGPISPMPVRISNGTRG